MNVLWRNNFFRENVKSITYSKYVPVVLGMQQAMRMRHIVICGLSDLSYFATLSPKRHDFRKKVIEHNMCVMVVSTNLSQTFLILRRIQRDITVATQVFMQSTCYSCHILMNLEISRQMVEK